MPIYTDPGFVVDVVGDVDPPTAEWANAIRDRVLHHFASTGDRDTAIPSPTTGMRCIDTSTLAEYLWNGTAWLPYDHVVQTYTPTLSQGASTNIAKTVNEARYMRRWTTCKLWLSLSPTAAGTAGSEVRASLPATAAGHNGATLGTGLYADASVATYLCEALLATGNNVRLRSYSSGAIVGVNPNIAVATGDTFNCSIEFTT